MEDIIDQHRKKPLNSSTKPPKGPKEYVAFDAKDKVLCLTLLRQKDPARSPQYAYKMDVVYDDAQFTNFVIVYTYMLVLVRGFNLEPVIAALKMNTADFIQEFDPLKWEKPKDPTAPFIKSIEVVLNERGPTLSESEQLGKTLH